MIRKIQSLVGLTIFVACTTATQPPKSTPKATVPASQAQPVVEILWRERGEFFQPRELLRLVAEPLVKFDELEIRAEVARIFTIDK